MDTIVNWPGGDWQATARLVGTLIVGYVALIWLASLIWIYRDITARTREPISQIVSLGIGAVLPLVGLPIYMALRLSETLQQAYDREIEQEAILADIQTAAACPSCGRAAESTFRVCAYCGTPLKDPCPRCREPMLHAWRYCPHCATPRAAAAHPSTSRRATRIRRAGRATAAAAPMPGRAAVRAVRARRRGRPRARAHPSAGHGRLTRALRVSARRTKAGRPRGRPVLRSGQRGDGARSAPCRAARGSRRFAPDARARR